jgi:hypothetical protein
MEIEPVESTLAEQGKGAIRNSVSRWFSKQCGFMRCRRGR